MWIILDCSEKCFYKISSLLIIVAVIFLLFQTRTNQVFNNIWSISYQYANTIFRLQDRSNRGLKTTFFRNIISHIFFKLLHSATSTILSNAANYDRDFIIRVITVYDKFPSDLIKYSVQLNNDCQRYYQFSRAHYRKNKNWKKKNYFH